jgi:glucose-1-phosphate cytidylyltransferase
MEAGDDLVEPTFRRLIDDRQLLAYDYDGFWHAVDTAKDKDRVDTLYAKGDPPWCVWDRASPPREADVAEAARGGSGSEPVAVETD